jgi:hypothetical protein
MTRRRWMRMMVIVPALAESEQGNGPVVPRVVAGDKPAAPFQKCVRELTIQVPSRP